MLRKIANSFSAFRFNERSPVRRNLAGGVEQQVMKKSLAEGSNLPVFGTARPEDAARQAIGAALLSPPIFGGNGCTSAGERGGPGNNRKLQDWEESDSEGSDEEEASSRKKRGMIPKHTCIYCFL